MLWWYNLISWFAVPMALPWLAYRALRGRLPGLGQRLGLLPRSLPPLRQPVVWLHAVSLGEVTAAAAFIEVARSRMPQMQWVMTSSTRTGWEAARRILPPEAVLFPPIDWSWVCRRFLRRLRPKLLLVLETELWPNLFREAKRFGIPLIVVNGRISDKAYPRYHATRWLWRRVLALPDMMFAQSASDADRFQALGAPAAKVRVAGNLKFVLRPNPSPIVEILQRVISDAGAQPVIVAGSTMPGEEKYLFDAYQRLLPEFPRLLMMVAPRHPERFASVAGEARAGGLPLQLRSEWREDSTLQSPGIFLLDSVGELGSAYELATIAFVGGTLVPTGGHNILEAAYFSKPIVIGPSMNNFREIAAEFLRDAGIGSIPDGNNIRVGSIIQVPDADEMVVALRFLLRNPAAARRLGEAAQAILNQKTSGLHFILEEIERQFASRKTWAQEPAGLVRKTLGAATTSLFHAITQARVALYHRGLLSRKRLGAKVISLGNLSFGGTGKTPLAIWLASRLQEAGLRVSILTRGYRRRSRQAVQILAPGTDPEQARDAGDEAQLYLRHLLTPVGIAASRYEAGRLLEAQFAVDVHLLDDGFQHLALARDLDLVLIDAGNPWGARDGLPHLLRESPSALQRAHAIVLTRCESAEVPQLNALRTSLEQFNPNALFFSSRTRLVAFCEPTQNITVSVGEMRARRPVTFCGLGHPENFFTMLERAGITVAGSETFSDHHRYSLQGVAWLEKLASRQGADCLLTTEKDLMNLPPDARFRLPLFWAVTETVVEEEDRFLCWIWTQLGLPADRLSAVVSPSQQRSGPSARQPVRSL
ncbi:MAG: tetraacyldisaccharide 4'-kinase [Acidobacteria bacterium RIFCSPLOWO2_02_FULL_59_13]|nr:MAG: tetraacyldisaccharide 4'-kinase [Acidobacteria bacterium RIFCSPLOWO2_02_FULL_59_13]